MRLHRPLVFGVVSALREIFLNGGYADKVVAQVLKSNPKWGSRDRAFVAEQVYDMVRWWRLLCELDSIPYDHPPEDEVLLIRLAGIQLILKGETLPEWEAFNGLAPEVILQKHKEWETNRAISQSIPDWLDQLAQKELGETWDELITALNQTACVSLRVNTLKSTKDELAIRLAAEGIETNYSSLADNALLLKKRTPISRNPLYRKGLFEIQDTGSQCIAPFLDVSPGMQVIDACAGAGGKTLHLAALMHNQGNIISMDVEHWKLKELKRRLQRNGVNICQRRLIRSPKNIRQLFQSADRLLIDAPCSGLGVLKRKPDTKWKLSPAFIEKARQLQADILNRYSTMLKPGGKMVYATCSILPSENEQQVAQFLQTHRDFKLLEERTISPAKRESDGYYMALLEK